MKNKKLFGLSFYEDSYASLLQIIESRIKTKESFRIATVNPEFIVAAEKNTGFKQNLKEADVRIVDGFGLWLALKVNKFQGVRITGAALTQTLLQRAEQKGWLLAVVLPVSGLSSKEQVTEFFQQNYPGLLFTLFTEDQVSSGIQADITLIALGIPEQEYVSAKLPKGVKIGVGGALDFLIGTQKRAPKLFQTLGFEWLWRLFQQPKRAKRIFTAVIVFPFYALRSRLI